MTAMVTPRHRVSAATAQMRQVADSVADASVWSMEPLETTSTLVELTRLEAQVAELKLRVAGHANELDPDTANRWAQQTCQTRQGSTGVHGQIRLAEALAERHHVRAALATGDLVLDQARAIVHAIDALPADCDAALVERAERHLVGLADQHDAKQLRILGRRLLEVVAPDEADAHEAALLEAEERAAADACRLTMSDTGHGTVHGSFTLPSLQAAMLKKTLLALSAPKHLTATESEVRKPGPARLGLAFCELIERIPADRLPSTGGTDATIVVTMDLDVLTGRLERAGVLDTGERISPSAARRLACTAGIVPAVLGGRSEVLDLGRKRRFHSKAQRLALAQRDGGCTAEGCDWPPGMCHAHHDIRWADGGPTDLAHGRLLCPKHHARAHDPSFATAKLPSGRVAFHRRT